MYFEQAGISQSMLKMLRDPNTPADFHYRYLSGEYEEKTTKSLEFGTKLDMALFEPLLFADNYILLPGQKTTTKIGFIAEEEHKSIMKMVEKIKSFQLKDGVFLGDLLSVSDTQSILTWECPRTGVKRKGKPDIKLPNGILMDLKSAESAHPREFSKAAYKFGYHIQAADYLEGNRIQNNIPNGEFYNIVIEKTAPYKIALFKMTPDFITLGYQERDQLLDLYVKCSNDNYWPEYSENPIIELAPPAWAVSKESNINLEF